MAWCGKAAARMNDYGSSVSEGRRRCRVSNVFVEVSPGKVLCGLLKQIDPAQKSMNVEDAASLEKTLEELASA